MIVIAKSPIFLRSRFASVREWFIGVEANMPLVYEIEINLINHYQGHRAHQASPEIVKNSTQSKTEYKDTVKNLAADKRMSGVFLKVLNMASVLIILASLVVATVLYAPAAFYHFFPAQTKVVEPATEGTPMGGDFSNGAALAEEKEPYLPPKDESLPEGNWVIIPRIGVRTEMQRTEDYEKALETGVWWVPDFGSPGDQGKPIILVAHRFGYKWWWQDEYWKYHSFNLLPETEPGDIVEIISDQRKWTYEIYAGEEGTEISDYQGDMILYTCKYLNSPIRHFRYARLVIQE